MDIRKKRKKISTLQEKKATNELGMHMMPASGATLHGGGDGRLAGQLRLECKYTDKSEYILKLADIVKLRNQAIKGGLELPIFQIDFRGRTKFVVVPFEESFIELNRDPDTLTSIYSHERTSNEQIMLKYAMLMMKLSLFPLILRITFKKAATSKLDFFGEIDLALFEWNDFLRIRGE